MINTLTNDIMDKLDSESSDKHDSFIEWSEFKYYIEKALEE